MSVPDKVRIREEIISDVLKQHGIGRDEFFGKLRTARHVDARRQVAYRLKDAGFSKVRIAEIIKRNHHTVSYYFGDASARKLSCSAQRRLFRRISGDLQHVVARCAEAEGITIETLVAQWVSERAEHEIAAKARAEMEGDRHGHNQFVREVSGADVPAM
jgi:predicted HicB family RNase H-like nuclease